MYKVLITGAAGQLGRSLLQRTPDGAVSVGLDRSQLDISDAAATLACIEEIDPDIIINAAAYTAVDKAESEQQQAYAINAEGPANLAYAARQSQARLIHVSTDFVFDGAQSQPYAVDALTAPQSVYGASKLAGEAQVLAAHNPCVVVRSAWVYAAEGNNFMNTMLRLMAQRDSLSVVADQVGTPTAAQGLADFLWLLAGLDAEHFDGISRILHWTDAGVASWYDFAVAIYEEARALGILQGECRIVPIPTRDYPTPAQRPAFSVLDKSLSWQLSPQPPLHWREALRQTLRARQARPNVVDESAGLAAEK